MRSNAGCRKPLAELSFELLETLRWTPGEGFVLLERHLRRLETSARYFGFRCPLDEASAALDRLVMSSERALRVRLLLGRDGGIHVEAAPLEPTSRPIRVGLAAGPIDPANQFLFHKTTNRDHLEHARRAGWDETILWNPARQVTEALTANVVVELDGRAVTPPVECGLLAGTMRAELLASGDIVEAPVAIEELRRASRVWLINSVRGWREAILAEPRERQADTVSTNPGRLL
jgi:para-aminobenzoate synthetase/4-amino-4-deoxychorismate lyase